jgi:osmotically-inducible protein OsmY
MEDRGLNKRLVALPLRLHISNARAGELDMHTGREAAELAVQQLTSVRSVTNEIIVKPQASVGDVRARIERAFHFNADIDAQNVRVEVRGGAGVLTGTVRSESEREQAERASGPPARRSRL